MKGIAITIFVTLLGLKTWTSRHKFEMSFNKHFN